MSDCERWLDTLAWTDTARMWHALGNGEQAFAALRRPSNRRRRKKSDGRRCGP
ncbi:hypothetical protein ACFWP3_07710 [Streptomyces sp. NPDC058525]|uniref:hypothetical protein n=1 Tax=Streptomyces sp. NPDC058525 TaxID=3346538 RepID=UPI00365584C1